MHTFMDEVKLFLTDIKNSGFNSIIRIYCKGIFLFLYLRSIKLSGPEETEISYRDAEPGMG